MYSETIKLKDSSTSSFGLQDENSLEVDNYQPVHDILVTLLLYNRKKPARSSMHSKDFKSWKRVSKSLTFSASTCRKPREGLILLRLGRDSATGNSLCNDVVVR